MPMIFVGVIFILRPAFFLFALKSTRPMTSTKTFFPGLILHRFSWSQHPLFLKRFLVSFCPVVHMSIVLQKVTSEQMCMKGWLGIINGT